MFGGFIYMYLITCHYLRSALNAFDKKLCTLHSELKCISMVSVLFFKLKQYTVCFNGALLTYICYTPLQSMAKQPINGCVSNHSHTCGKSVSEKSE